MARFRLKLKKVGKTTRPFRYDLNQNPYDYTVEVTNRFKGLDLIHPGSGRSPGTGSGNYSSILAWRIPWTEEPGGLQFMGLQRVGHD